MNWEDATQLDVDIALEPVLRERRREWRLLAPIEPELHDQNCEPVRVAELVELSDVEEEGEKVLGFVQRRRHSFFTILYQGFVTGMDLESGRGVRSVQSAEEAFENAKHDVEEALATA